MRILIVSDTHGKVGRVKKIYRKLSQTSPIDLIVHCGDYYEDAMKIQSQLGTGVLAVRGNCDRCYDENEYAILDTEAGSFFVTHGHMHNVKESKQTLYYTALEHECVGVIYGHTHRAEKADLGDFLFINPGSLNRPRDGSEGTFALLETSDRYAQVKLIRYRDLFPKEETTEGEKAGTQTAAEAGAGAGAGVGAQCGAGAGAQCGAGAQAGAVAGAQARAGAEAGAQAGAESNPSGTGSPKPGSPPKKKVKGGFLRNLLNYSDRL